jgi:site-specific recombinase XerD
LLEKLREARRVASIEYVCLAPQQQRISYEWYQRTLRRYCKEANVRMIGTHGLRHSTAALYMHHGATQDDLRQLFAHASASTTAIVTAEALT